MAAPSFKTEMERLLDEDEGIRNRILSMVEQSTVLKEIRLLREDTNRRFESVIEENRLLREDMDKRFEAVDKRFEAMQQQMDRRFEAVDRRFEALIGEMRQMRLDLPDQISAAVSKVGSRWGIQTEEAVRSFARRFIAEEFGVQAQEWKYKDAQLDVVVHDGKHHLIEVTSVCTVKSITKFLRHAALYQRKTRKTPARRLIVTAHASGDAWQLALKEGLQIISG